MKERTLTVKGSGSVKRAPDQILLTLNLTTTKLDYAQAADQAAADLEALRQALVGAGHEAKDLKTTDFSVRTEYESVRDESDNWTQVFKGYASVHQLKLAFDLDLECLSQTLAAISQSGAKPQLEIHFTIKDEAALQAQLLEKAVANAFEKAAVLAEAGGVKLGSVQQIHYDWGGLRPLSDTRLAEAGVQTLRAASLLQIQPEEIEARDSVTVIWSIE